MERVVFVAPGSYFSQLQGFGASRGLSSLWSRPPLSRWLWKKTMSSSKTKSITVSKAFKRLQKGSELASSCIPRPRIPFRRVLRIAFHRFPDVPMVHPGGVQQGDLPEALGHELLLRHAVEPLRVPRRGVGGHPHEAAAQQGALLLRQGPCQERGQLPLQALAVHHVVRVETAEETT